MKSNNWLILTIIVVVIMIGVVGFLLDNEINNISLSPIPTAAPRTGNITPPAAKEWKITLNAVSKEYLQTGKATLKENNGRVRVEIDADQLAGINNQPAHIHIDSCPGVGRVLFPLNNVVDGKSNTVINTTLDQLKGQLPLAINLHKSAQEVDIYTSCGNIVK